MARYMFVVIVACIVAVSVGAATQSGCSLRDLTKLVEKAKMNALHIAVYFSVVLFLCRILWEEIQRWMSP
jgi:hypothetical protein